MSADPYEKHRDAARKRFHHSSPRRLGFMVGLSGEDLPNPYPHQQVASRNYLAGLAYGKECREDEAAQRATKETP